jgi:alpha-galactosidase
MKRNFFILLSVAAAVAGCSRQATVTSGDLSLKVDGQMRLQVSSLNPASNELYADFVESDALYGEDFAASQFALKSVNESEQNGDKVWDLVGTYDQNGVSFEKHTSITAPANQPGMVLLETYYINKSGKEMAVTGWKANELRINVADTMIWSFVPTSTSRRADWIQPVTKGYYKKNFLGMNNTDYGGGIPMVDLWRRDAGIATGLTEDVLKTADMPVQWMEGDDYASMALRYDLGRRILAQGDTLRVFDSFIAVHTGDFYNPLNQFSRTMEDLRGMEFPDSDPEAYEPVWCAWGYARTFTINEVLGTLPKVKELGFKWVDVDDGFQIAEGDWETNNRFPGGDRDMRRMTDAIHALGMRAKLWWAPLAADPGTKVLEERPEMLLRTELGGMQWISWWNSYYLSPVNPVTEEYTNELLDRFINVWGFDGLKLDGQHMNGVLPDYNRASRLDYPEQSMEQMPSYFKNVYEKTRGYKPYSVVQFCPCGDAINFFMIPYFNQAVSSDPTSSYQIRHKGKAYRAINDELAYYADHVELSDNGDDFGTHIGIGGVVGSKFTWPRDNPDVRERNSPLLTPEKEALIKKWVSIYNEKMVSTGDYLNLYDMGWDMPESHVINKDGKMYYAFYADQWDGGEIELRGLEAGKTYTVNEYTADEAKTYTVDGSNPVITPTFTRNYLIEVY